MNRETIEKIGNRMAQVGSMINITHRNSGEPNRFNYEFEGMVELMKAAGVRVEIIREIDNLYQIESFELNGFRFLCEGF